MDVADQGIERRIAENADYISGGILHGSGNQPVRNGIISRRCNVIDRCKTVFIINGIGGSSDMVNLVEIIVERPITFCSRNRKRNIIRNFRYRKRRRRIITVEKTVKFTASTGVNETVRNIRYGIVMNRIRLCRRRAADVKAAASVDRQRTPVPDQCGV